MKIAFNWKFYKLKRKVWFWVCAYAVLGALTALLGALASYIIPNYEHTEGFGSESVSAILTILASSMLAVTTFSLSIMVQAFGSASTGATPRSTSLLMSDATTQNVLSTFLGVFVYSIVGIIGLHSRIYGAPGRMVLFWVTVVVLIAVLWQLVRWINHLSNFGRLGDTIDRVETAVMQSIENWTKLPRLGGNPVPETFLHSLVASITPETVGYVEYIDMEHLQELAEENDFQIKVCDLPGGFVHQKSVILEVFGGQPISDETIAEMVRCVSIVRVRTFEQDPRFGVVTLSEIAARALSPATNDSGTAIDIIGRYVRILSCFDPDVKAEPLYPLVFVPRLETEDLMEDAFLSTIRDAGGLVEVHVRIQKTLLSLVELKPEQFAKTAVHYSKRSMDVCELEMKLPADVERVRKIHDKIRNLSDSR